MSKPTRIKNKNGLVSYRIFVRKTIDGNEVRESKTFSKKELAQQWHDKRLQELEYESIHGRALEDTIGEIIARYQDQYANSYGRSKNYDIARLLRYPIAQIQCSKLSPKHICIFHPKPATDSSLKQPLILVKTRHSFRFKPASDSGLFPPLLVLSIMA